MAREKLLRQTIRNKCIVFVTKKLKFIITILLFYSVAFSSVEA